MDRAGIGQWSLCVATGTLIVSDTFRSVLQWPLDFAANEGDLLEAVLTDDRLRFIDHLAACAEQARPFGLSHRMMTRGGAEILVETRGAPVVGSANAVIRIAAASKRVDLAAVLDQPPSA